MIETLKLDGGIRKGENYGLFNDKISEIGNWPQKKIVMLHGMKCLTSRDSWRIKRLSFASQGIVRKTHIHSPRTLLNSGKLLLFLLIHPLRS